LLNWIIVASTLIFFVKFIFYDKYALNIKKKMNYLFNKTCIYDSSLKLRKYMIIYDYIKKNAIIEVVLI